jgi:hypothetical protein
MRGPDAIVRIGVGVGTGAPPRAAAGKLPGASTIQVQGAAAVVEPTRAFLHSLPPPF